VLFCQEFIHEEVIMALETILWHSAYSLCSSVLKNNFCGAKLGVSGRLSIGFVLCDCAGYKLLRKQL